MNVKNIIILPLLFLLFSGCNLTGSEELPGSTPAPAAVPTPTQLPVENPQDYSESPSQTPVQPATGVTISHTESLYYHTFTCTLEAADVYEVLFLLFRNGGYIDITQRVTNNNTLTWNQTRPVPGGEYHVKALYSMKNRPTVYYSLDSTIPTQVSYEIQYHTCAGGIWDDSWYGWKGIKEISGHPQGIENIVIKIANPFISSYQLMSYRVEIDNREWLPWVPSGEEAVTGQTGKITDIAITVKEKSAARGPIKTIYYEAWSREGVYLGRKENGQSFDSSDVIKEIRIWFVC